MLLLPKTIGSFTLHRKLGTGGVAESYVGTHDTNGGRPVVIRRVLPYVQRDPARLAVIDGRVKDLLGVRHPFLVHVIESFSEGDERYIVEEHIDGVNLDKILAWCRQNQRQVPHNVFLNIATQVCNGLEALHGRAGKGTSAEHVLHLALKPGAIFVTRDGKVMVGSYGLTRSPTTLPHGGVAGPVPTRMEYLSPEQTQPDQKLTPSSDIFALGALLYELLTLDSLFRAESNLQTIDRVRRAEITTQLLRVKELMPGLDKVLYRALSLNPRHRYQRAFVLREDLRGLMAGYSFATIAEDTRTFLAPLLENLGPVLASGSDASPAPAEPEPVMLFAADIGLDGFRTPLAPGPDGEDWSEQTERTSPRGTDDPPTALRAENPSPGHEHHATLPGIEHSTLIIENPPPPSPDPTAPEVGRAPDNTAAFIKRESPPAPDLSPPADTAAFIARESAAAPVPQASPATIVPPRTAAPAAAVATPPSPRVSDGAEPPPSNESSWVVMGGAALALVAVFGCAGIGWWAWTSLRTEESPVVVAPPSEPSAGAAAVMADAAPPRLEPIEDPPSVSPSAPEPAVPAPVASAAPSTTTATASAPATPSRATTAPAAASPRLASPPADSTRPATPVRTSAPPVATFDAPMDISVEEVPLDDLDRFADTAKRGKLQSIDTAVLEAVAVAEPQYTRSSVLLLMNSQHKGDDKGTRKYLDQLMVLPENQYNPVYLTDYARWHVNHAEYTEALHKTTLAERYWARIPPELVFSKKAEIYEIQAAAYQGRFYKSSEDLQLLGSAIAAWEQYRQHVTTRSRTDLQKRADAELARLQDIREKLQ